MTPIERIKSELKAIADTIREKTGTTDLIPFDQIKTKMEEIQGDGSGETMPNTIVLVDDDGNECVAVLTEEDVPITATVNDVREGMTVVTEKGIEVGEKFIPPYYTYTSAGYRIITNGKSYTIPLTIRDAYDYTSIQCVISQLGSDLSASVSTDRVVINNKVYPTNSTIAESELSKDSDAKAINLNITNNSGKSYVIRYFTYKEEL